ncbi:MAG: response regulator, partial [Planctomycetota bacterium]
MRVRRRVLIVDDERNFADLLGKEIARMGFDTEVAYDSDSALALLEKSEFDVTLLDIKMP